MLHPNKKIKAFTIAEMLVVLVISSILITITILVLSLTQKQIRNIQTIYIRNTETRLLERTLWQDFNTHRLFYDNKTHHLLCTSEIDSVTYGFYKNYIIRNSDTIKVAIIDKTLFLHGEKVQNKFIDAIEIQVSKKLKNKKLFIFKINDATHYMNN